MFWIIDKSRANIKSGSIGIISGRNQETALPSPLYYSGATGIDMTLHFNFSLLAEFLARAIDTAEFQHLQKAA